MSALNRFVFGVVLGFCVLIALFASDSTRFEFRNVPFLATNVSHNFPANHGDSLSVTCFVSQIGNDGFGHQTLGKLSLVILAELLKPKFKYVHVPYNMFDHSNLQGKEVETFAGFGKLFPDESAYDLNKRVKVKNFSSFVKDVLSGKLACDPDAVYFFDSAFDYVFRGPNGEAVNNVVQRSATFHRIREAYLASPKPPLGFSPNRPNVAIHVRRGDAMERSPAEAYLIKAVEFYEAYFAELGQPRPYFIVNTDDLEWDFLKILQNDTGSENILLNQETNDFRSGFHQMVMADGLITSTSSFSASAAFFRDLRIPVVAPPGDYHIAAISAFHYIQ